MRLPLANDSLDKPHILWWLVWIVLSCYDNWRKIFRISIMFLSFGLLTVSFVPGQSSSLWPTSVTISRLGSFYGYAFNIYRPLQTRECTRIRIIVLIVCEVCQVAIIGLPWSTLLSNPPLVSLMAFISSAILIDTVSSRAIRSAGDDTIDALCPGLEGGRSKYHLLS